MIQHIRVHIGRPDPGTTGISPDPPDRPLWNTSRWIRQIRGLGPPTGPCRPYGQVGRPRRSSCERSANEARVDLSAHWCNTTSARASRAAASERAPATRKCRKQPEAPATRTTPRAAQASLATANKRVGERRSASNTVTQAAREQREADERAAHETHAPPNKRAIGVRESASPMPAAQGAGGADNACDARKRRRQHVRHQRSKANSTASERTTSDGG
jgi:hypothetical protein